MNIEEFVNYINHGDGNVIYNKLVMSPNRKVDIYVIAGNPAVQDAHITVSMERDPYNRWKHTSIAISNKPHNPNIAGWWDESVQLGNAAFNEFVNKYLQSLPAWEAFAERFPNEFAGMSLNPAMVPPVAYGAMEYMYDGREITSIMGGMSLMSGSPVLITPLGEYGFLVDYIRESTMVVTHNLTNFVAIRV